MDVGVDVAHDSSISPFTCMHARTHARARLRACVRAHVRACVHACVCVRARMHLCVCVCVVADGACCTMNGVSTGSAGGMPSVAMHISSVATSAVSALPSARSYNTHESHAHTYVHKYTHAHARIHTCTHARTCAHPCNTHMHTLWCLAHRIVSL